MVVEVEMKVEADHDDVVDRLEKVGAEAHGEKTQHDVYYSAPHRDFSETDEALRTRREDGDVYVTYKGPKLDRSTKSRREVDLRVGSLDVADDLLKSLGFTEFGRVRKHRRKYVYGDYVVVLDDVEGLDEYVEVETVVGEDEWEEAREGVREMLRRLQLDPSKGIRDSYLQLLHGSGEQGG